MSLKVIDSNVCELIKCVAHLTSEVGSLRTIVMEQNTIISQQAQLIGQIKSKLEGKQTAEIQPAIKNTEQALQRPVRQARLKAAAARAANAGSTAAALKKSSANNAQLALGNISVMPKVPVASEYQLERPVSTTIPAQIAEATGNTLLTKSFNYTGNKNVKIDNSNTEIWTKVEKRRTKQKARYIITGSGKPDNELQTVERLKHIRAWSFKPETTVQNVVNYLNKIKPSDKYTVIKRDIKTDKHAAFVIGFPESLYECISSPNMWPEHVKIQTWFLARRHGKGFVGTTNRDACSSPTESQRKHGSATSG